MLNNTEISHFNYRDGMLVPFHHVDEEWRMITDTVIENITPVYAISNYGRVANIKSRIILRQDSINSGYLKVTLYLLDGTPIDCTIHRLLMSTFDNKPYHNDMIINHKDPGPDKKGHNYYDNLEWTTYSGNLQHAYDNNLRPIGESHNFNIYPESMIRIICEGLEKRLDYKTIASSIGMTFEEARGIIGVIKNKKAWKHVSSEYNIPSTRRNDQVFTDDQADYICKMILEGLSSKEILINLGYNLDSMDSKSKDRLRETIRKIRVKDRYTHISDKYF